jgi:hypothetical protein
MERIRREPELLKELEKIMERVKQARSEYTAPEVNYAATATANVIFHYYCERCKNQVQPSLRITCIVQYSTRSGLLTGNNTPLHCTLPRSLMYFFTVERRRVRTKSQHGRHGLQIMWACHIRALYQSRCS